jgi:collagenase-like PrtC family protease/predicted lipid carrier protein YhbT
MRISVGPTPSHWGVETIENFYRELAKSPVDFVYLGETACAERSCFSPDLLRTLNRRLTDAGKHVYASSLNLVTDQEQYRIFEETARTIGRIEINSPAFLGLAEQYPAVSGVFINVYNSVAANALADCGLERIVLPCELDFESILSVTTRGRATVEVVVHGHVPIAIAPTCQTARALGRNGNGCGMICQDFPDGMLLEADGQVLFRIDGPRTLSAKTCCLVEYLPQLDAAGVDTIRILPQSSGTADTLRIYRDVLDHRLAPADALERLKRISPIGLCSGWFAQKAGWVYESPNTPTRRSTDRSIACPNQDNRAGKEFAETRSLRDGINAVYPSGDGCTDQVMGELGRLVEQVCRDPHFVKQLSDFKATTVVLGAPDTGRELMITFEDQGVRAAPYAGGPFDVMVRAREEVHLAVLSGQMDADAAFFTGKVQITGSVLAAFRVKNNFLSLVQRHLAKSLQADGRLVIKLSDEDV